MRFRHIQLLVWLTVASVVLQSRISLAGEAACRNPDAIGISRVQEVDATGGPMFGAIQYVHADTFLADKEVVLTFDDGPFPETTPAILQALAEQCTKATFFYVGRMALKNPDILAQVDAAGQTIATHTWSHADLRKLSGPRAQAEIERGISLLQARLGHPIAPFFRFPYLSDPKADIRYLAGRDFAVFSADVDSWDSHGLTPSAHIVNYVMTRLKEHGRGVVLMHDIKHTTAAALPEILRQLKAGGYKIVHMVAKTPATSLSPYDAWAREIIEQNDNSALLAANTKPSAGTKLASAKTGRRQVLASNGISKAPDLLVPAVAKPANGQLTAAIPVNAGTEPVWAPARAPSSALAGTGPGAASRIVVASNALAQASPAPSILPAAARSAPLIATAPEFGPGPDKAISAGVDRSMAVPDRTLPAAPPPTAAANTAPMNGLNGSTDPTSPVATTKAAAPAAIVDSRLAATKGGSPAPLPDLTALTAASKPVAPNSIGMAPAEPPALEAKPTIARQQPAAGNAANPVPAKVESDLPLALSARPDVTPTAVLPAPPAPVDATRTVLPQTAHAGVVAMAVLPAPGSAVGRGQLDALRSLTAVDQAPSAGPSAPNSPAENAMPAPAVRGATVSDVKVASNDLPASGLNGADAGADARGPQAAFDAGAGQAAVRAGGPDPRPIGKSRVRGKHRPAAADANEAAVPPEPVRLAMADTSEQPTAREPTRPVELSAAAAPDATAKALADSAAQSARFLRKRQIEAAADPATSQVAGLAPPSQDSPVVSRLRPLKSASPDTTLVATSVDLPATAPIKKKPLKPLKVAKATPAWLASGGSTSTSFTALPLSKK